jgi:monooxygenase
MTISSVSASDFDVLIVGAGLSGIGAGYLLNRDCPDKTFAILESRSAIGGTWDLFRYPGIRSDSDMYTLSYSFKPWRGRKSIVDGPDIKRYIEEVAEEGRLTPRIRFNHRVASASWSSESQRWSLEVDRTSTSGETLRDVLTCRFLYLGSGYYSYAEGYRPEFPGEQNYQGTFVHPQFWPENLDYAGKRIVVIGSGATAVTLVPALAQQAAHVTMLQRSPSYVASRPLVDRIAHGLQRWLPAPVAHGLTRWKNVFEGSFYYRIARRRPALFKKRLLEMARQELGPEFDMRHFTPDYNPWDQRVCAVPDGDLFKDLKEGRASVVTDTIKDFTADGIRLASGELLPADIVITATGLKLNAMGDIQFSVDGKPVKVSDCMTYKGMMLSGIPNCLMAFGYVNSSWTLKAELTAGYLCRLLQYMDRQGFAVAQAPRDPSVEEEPFLNFTSGYVQRAAGMLPKQGARRPWQVYQNYMQDMLTIRYSRIDDGVLRFQPSGDKA